MSAEMERRVAKQERGLTDVRWRTWILMAAIIFLVAWVERIESRLTALESPAAPLEEEEEPATCYGAVNAEPEEESTCRIVERGGNQLSVSHRSLPGGIEIVETCYVLTILVEPEEAEK